MSEVLPAEMWPGPDLMETCCCKARCRFNNRTLERRSTENTSISCAFLNLLKSVSITFCDSAAKKPQTFTFHTVTYSFTAGKGFTAFHIWQNEMSLLQGRRNAAPSPLETSFTNSFLPHNYNKHKQDKIIVTSCLNPSPAKIQQYYLLFYFVFM